MKKGVFLSTLAIVIAGGMLFASEAQAVDYTRPEAHIYDTKAKELKRFDVFDPNFKGGGKVAVGDRDANGKHEILVGAGKGGGPQVRMFNEKGEFNGYSFFPFHTDYRGGVDVAMGDTDGDGKDEMIVSQNSDGQAWVKVYEFDKNKTIRAEFNAYAPSFQGGAHVAACDINGDGKDEILTGSGVGSSGHVRGFDGSGKYMGFDLFPFEKGYKGGVDVACANVDGGSEEEIVVGKSWMGQAQVKVYKNNKDKQILGDFLAYDQGHKEGVNVVGGDIDGDGEDEIITGTNGNGPQVRAFEAYGAAKEFSKIAYPSDFRGGVNVAFGNVNAEGLGEVVTMPGRRVWEGRQGVAKYIEIDTSKQRLYAYENGRKVYEMKVSTGLDRFPTPKGDFSIERRKRNTRMRWEYGPNHPDNYDLPDVPHVQYFTGPYALHGAYWHNDFGRPKSHGCVNLSLPDAAKIYSWSDYGDKVFVR